MEVVIKGALDMDSISAAAINAYAAYVIDAARIFFGDPVNVAEFEAWRRERMCINDKT